MSDSTALAPVRPDLDHDLALNIAALIQAAQDPPLDASGRPGKFTPDVLTRIVAALKLGHTVNDACVFAGISTKTYQNWMRWGQSGEEPYSLFVEVIERLNVAAYSHAVECFSTGARTDPKVAERFLVRRAPKEWGTREEQTGGTITVNIGGIELKGGPI